MTQKGGKRPVFSSSGLSNMRGVRALEISRAGLGLALETDINAKTGSTSFGSERTPRLPWSYQPAIIPS
jgi:hypothetical protein